MSDENLERSLKAIALTVARGAGAREDGAVRSQGRDTAAVFKLEDHFRDRNAMKNCIVEPIRHGPNRWYEVLSDLEL